MFTLKVKFLIAFMCFFRSAFGTTDVAWWDYTTIDRTWWKNTTLYQVLLPSFMDGDGDGYGDLKGLTSKLDYLVDLGIETILITPHCKSPDVKYAGYDIIDYVGVNPLLGTMHDFDELMEEMNKRNLKLIIDMVINHSSNKHPWFIHSVNKKKPYTDYYVWKDPAGYDRNGNPIPPNNWQNVIEGSSWTWNAKRKQFYLHQFIKEMPDLNLRNIYVLHEFKKIMEFWSDKGVAGFRLDAYEHFVEDAEFRNEPMLNLSTPVIKTRYDQVNMFTQHVDDSLEVVHKLRQITDYLTIKSGDFERILVPESNSRKKELYRIYGSSDYKLVHFPLSYWITWSYHYENAFYYRNLVDGYLGCLPRGSIANWVSENHDIPRKAQVFNEEYELILTTMVLLLPGVAYIYYGQELGVAGWRFPDKSIESQRLPMIWDDSTNAGFTNNNSKPYLPISPDYRKNNVKKQKAEKDSHYNKVKTMISWRKSDVLKYGDVKSYVLSDWVYSFTRRLDNEIYLATFNLGNTTEFVNLRQSIEKLPHRMVVKLASNNSDYETGDVINTKRKFRLEPQSTVVLYPKRIRVD
ncbi:maltase 1-like [Planococcus citri]|uniref:maltase 1-like n=1 Tax=Planococcus citri TaxID=170843 RepID=UPI0031F72690